jgi:hypothetical protein
MPELMAPYFDLIDSWLPDWRLNARKIFGLRGVLLRGQIQSSNHSDR